MTGETKVGLLIGLSVIIVFAMILSHKNDGGAEIKPPPRLPDVHSEYIADLTPTELPHSRSRRPMASPRADHTAPILPNGAEQPAIVAAVPQALPPSQPGAQPNHMSEPVNEYQFEPAALPRSAGSPLQMDDELRRQIEGAGEAEEQPTEPRGRGRSRVPIDEPFNRRRPKAESERTYVAQANDNLTKIASRFLGSGSVDNVNRLYELNRDVLPDKNSLMVGQKLRLPANAAVAGATPTSDGIAATPPPARPAPERTYQVQRGDTYASIAREHLGSAKRWREIYELNKSRFPDADLVPAGAKIRLPPESLRLASR